MPSRSKPLDKSSGLAEPMDMTKLEARAPEPAGPHSPTRRSTKPRRHATKPARPAPDEPALGSAEAYRAAEAAGGTRAHAYRLWSGIYWHTRYLLEEGIPSAKLTDPEIAILEAAAHGHPVDDEALARVLARAEQLDKLLSFRVLKHYPRMPLD
jgi:hypothetical protein